MTYSAFEVDLYCTLRTLDAQHDIVNQQPCTSHAFAHIYVNAYPHPFFDQLWVSALARRRYRRYRLWFAHPLYCRTMADHPDPVAVTLVSGNDEDLRWFKKEVDIREWSVIELLKFYDDLSLPADPMMDYTDEWVIRMVVGLVGFPTAVEYIIECAASAWNGDVKMFILGDLHRASVTSACVESQLNSLVHSHVGPGYAPLRVWNCNWFSFNRCSGTWTWQQQKNSIADWADVGGWEMTVGPTTEI